MSIADLAHGLALGLDPVRFARRSGIDPDPWQAEFLRSNAQEEILCCSRQSGKSTITAVKALHEASYRPPALVLLLSPTERQSVELLRKVKDTQGALRRSACAVKDESVLRLEFTNGSRIVALPGTERTVRAFSAVRLLIIDEAARVDDELYHAVRPMLAVSGGRLVLLSTPYGRRGFFHDAWTQGGPSWKRTKITADMCPRISPEFLAAERAQTGDWSFMQEYQCVFTETEDSLFNLETIEAALRDDITALFAEALPFRGGDIE